MWKASGVQLALFCLSVGDIRAEALFELAFGSQPDSVQSNRVLTAANPLQGVALGAIDGLNYELQVQPGRIDVLVSKTQGDGLDADILGGTFECPPVLDTMISVVERLKSEVLQSFRVSLVATLKLPVADYKTAAEHIGGILGIDLARDHMSDLNFQVNRRKTLPQGWEINRLMRIGVMALHSFELHIDHNVGAPVAPRVPKNSVALVLDFNLVPQTSVLSPDDQVEIAKALRDEILVTAQADNLLLRVLND